MIIRILSPSLNMKPFHANIFLLEIILKICLYIILNFCNAEHLACSRNILIKKSFFVKKFSIPFFFKIQFLCVYIMFPTTVILSSPL